MKLNKEEQRLIFPVLDGNFYLPLKDFCFENHETSPNIDAEICIDSDNHAFLLILRAMKNDDLPKCENKKGEFTVKDTVSASASYDGGIKIELKNIWPSHNQTVQVIGPGFSEKHFHFNSLLVPSDSSNIFDDWGMLKALLNKIEDAGGVPDEDLTIPIPNETESINAFAVSYFSNVNLRFKNTGVTESEEHPFWDKKTRSHIVSWDGEILGYRFSACQIGNHIKLGLEGKSVSAVDFYKFHSAFTHAFAFIHQINPWHTYQEVRLNGKIFTRSLKPVYQTQGRFKLFWEAHALQGEINANSVLESLTKWFLSMTPKQLSQYERLLNNFRGADNTLLPFDSQLLGVCTTLEGLLCTLPKPEETPIFSEIKKLALDILERRCRKTDGHRQDIWMRLKGYIQSWQFASRRESWNHSMGELFPKETEHIIKCFNLFEKLRNPLAHGGVSSSATIENLGLLAGLVNCILLSMSDYNGKCLKSPFNDDMIHLRRIGDIDE